MVPLRISRSMPNRVTMRPPANEPNMPEVMIAAKPMAK